MAYYTMHNIQGDLVPKMYGRATFHDGNGLNRAGIIMDFIDVPTLESVASELTSDERIIVREKLESAITQLSDLNIVHARLQSSNTLYRREDHKIFLLGFGEWRKGEEIKGDTADDMNYNDLLWMLFELGWISREEEKAKRHRAERKKSRPEGYDPVKYYYGRGW